MTMICILEGDNPSKQKQVLNNLEDNTAVVYAADGTLLLEPSGLTLKPYYLWSDIEEDDVEYKTLLEHINVGMDPVPLIELATQMAQGTATYKEGVFQGDIYLLVQGVADQTWVDRLQQGLEESLQENGLFSGYETDVPPVTIVTLTLS